MQKVHRVQFHYDVVDRLLQRRKIPLPQKGERHGKLIVTGNFGYVRSGFARLMVSCRCDCGTEEYYVYAQTLSAGKAASCGCVPKGYIRPVHRRKAESPLYSTWVNMRVRCHRPKSKSYKWYGAKGVSVNADWLKDFWAFHDWAMSNGWKDGLTLDRIESTGNYEPSNCRWATSAQQARNKSDNVNVRAFGEERVLMDWISDPRCVIDFSVASWRLLHGFEPERALSEPAFRGAVYSAFGETKGLPEWARDPRCVVAINTLRERVKPERNMTFEAALITPPASKPVAGREVARAKRRAKNALKRVTLQL